MASVVGANKQTNKQQAAADDELASRPPPPPDPRLLMAARRGDSMRLKELLVELQPEDDDEEKNINEELMATAVTIEGDSLLHVLAACGDDDGFLHCAKMIAGDDDKKRRRQLQLQPRNNKGNTPLHCAAAAANAKMISCLVGEMTNDDDARDVKKLLRMQNKCRETALHQAVRAAANNSKLMGLDCIDKLMDMYPKLACIPREGEEEEGGASPLYLAVSLGDMDLAQHLFDRSQGDLSYSGPRGRNVLHAAVSCGQVAALPTVLLDWLPKTVDVRRRQEAGGRHAAIAAGDLLRHLTSQRDKDNGSNPLHLAASLWGLPSAMSPLKGTWVVSGPPATELLLKANLSAAYQPDKQGMYPIHVAASAGDVRTVDALLKKCPDSAILRDARGRTILHVAVEKRRRRVVKYVLGTTTIPWHLYIFGRPLRPVAAVGRLLSSILNVQDNKGDTALHRAVHAGDLRVFNYLIRKEQVRLDVPNNKGMRPVDISWSTMRYNAFYAWDARMHIRRSLLIVGAPYGEGCRGDLFDGKHVLPDKDADKMSGELTAAAQVLALFSVLITTVTFASAFTLPGGYRSAGDDGGGVAGTPVLAGSYAFDAFILADALAFICSFFATSLLIYAGVPVGSLDGRFVCINLAYTFMMNSGRSLVAAFGLGLYVVLLPVARTIPISIAVLAVMLAVPLTKRSEGFNYAMCLPIFGRRRRRTTRLDSLLDWGSFVLERFWSTVLIFGIPAIRKWARTR